jgi:hypothetical protein
LRANIVGVASDDFNCDPLAKHKEDQDDEKCSPEDKVKVHELLMACYLHKIVKSKLYKLGEMTEDLQYEFVDCRKSIKEGLMMHKKSLNCPTEGPSP